MLQYFDGFYMTDDKGIILSKSVEVNNLMKKAYWAQDRKLSVMRNAIANSLNYAIFETKTERLVGYARVVTDYATMFYLTDVYIEKAFRGRGLGKKLVEWIVLHEDRLAGINGLLKTRDAKALYEKYGFEECTAICMVHTRNSR